MPSKLTIEEFIEKAKLIHGDKYDYSKVKYVNSHTHVIVVCPKHGEFLITPNNLLHGRNCPKCKTSSRKMSVDEFIRLANEKHNNKYDYSKVVYKNCDAKVCIICPEHGEFYQTPYNHLKGQNCPKCRNNYPMNNETFILKAKEIHGNKYDYSKVEYKNYETKVCIICPIHGEFYQTPNKHLNGCGCPKCKGKYKTTEDYIRQAKEVHKDEYSYDKTKYVDNKTKVCITCPIHGEFWQLPNNHLQGKGCPICGLSKHSKKNTEKFIQEATEKHNGKYDYSKTIYVRNTSKVIITCPKHGDFLQTPKDHLNGCGCPKCKRSLLEEETEKMLNETSLSYFAQYRAKWLKLQSIDFYIPLLNLGIECQGKQHYQAVEIFGGEKALNDNIQRDKMKKEICLKHNISMLYVFPNDANIQQIIENLPEIYTNENTIHLSDFNDYIKKILK